MIDKKPVKFCPVCAGKLVWNNDSKVLICEKCNYQFWRNSKPTVGAIIYKDEKVLLTKRSTEKLFGLWDVPGGFLDNGEDVVTGLRREVMEEVGVGVVVKKFINAEIEDDMDNILEDSHVAAIQFLCEIKKGEPKAGDETSEVRWFAKEDIPWDEIAFVGVRSAIEIVFGIKKPYLPE